MNFVIGSAMSYEKVCYGESGGLWCCVLTERKMYYVYNPV